MSRFGTYKGIVFKQSYKKRSDSKVRGANIAHLIYIATRKGTVYNKDCGFGLWGKITDYGNDSNINNLEHAKKEVAAASDNGRTVYRAILSLGHEVAAEKGFYKRETWQALVEEHARLFAEKNNIAHKDFRWVASFHYKAGHPHCHMMFWDSGKNPQTEGMEKGEFEIYAEKIRAGFNREIFEEEIRESQGISKAAGQKVQSEIATILRETKEKSCDFTRCSDVTLEAIGKDLQEIAWQLPARGSLKYGYLKQEAKKVVDHLSDKLIASASLNSVYRQYLQEIQTTAKLFGNSEETIAHQAESAKARLRADVGNQILTHIKQNGYLEFGDEALCKLEGQLKSAIRSACQLRRTTDEAYAKLLSLLPERRCPYGAFVTPEFEEQLKALTLAVLQDPVLSEQIFVYSNRKQAQAVQKGELSEPSDEEMERYRKELWEEKARKAQEEQAKAAAEEVEKQAAPGAENIAAEIEAAPPLPTAAPPMPIDSLPTDVAMLTVDVVLPIVEGQSPIAESVPPPQESAPPLPVDSPSTTAEPVMPEELRLMQAYGKEVYGQLFWETQDLLLSQLKMEYGWDTQRRIAIGTEMLLVAFGEVARPRAPEGQQKRVRGDLSKAAKKEFARCVAQRGDYEMEM